jgi:hypothetical protein
MTGIVRMAVLDLRTVAPYRIAGLAVFGLEVLLFASKPTTIVPALALLFASQIAAYPFNVADKAGLETLYAVLPLPRRSAQYGHYAWAMASFVATATVGTSLALLLARAQNVPFGGRTLETVLSASWALFAVNIAIQFPLLIRFGYTRTSVVGASLPLALVVGVVVRLHLSVASIQMWLPLLWIVGVAAIAASMAVAVGITGDRRRVRYPRPKRDGSIRNS